MALWAGLAELSRPTATLDVVILLCSILPNKHQPFSIGDTVSGISLISLHFMHKNRFRVVVEIIPC